MEKIETVEVSDGFDLEHEPYLGDPQAPIQIIEFADYKCPACKFKSDVEIGDKQGAKGTPTIFMNGKAAKRHLLRRIRSCNQPKLALHMDNMKLQLLSWSYLPWLTSGASKKGFWPVQVFWYDRACEGKAVP